MAFNDCIRDCSLEDLSTSGRKFSWTNKHYDGSRVWSRLDRAMAISTAPRDLNLLAEEVTLLAKLKTLKTAALKMLHQRPKIQDIKLNDCPTSYFLAKMAKRRQQGIVGQICDHHVVLVKGVDKVNIAFTEYYFELFSKAQPVQELDKGFIAMGACLSSNDHPSLCALVTPLKIKKALFSIGDNKSPGHDGFSAGFFYTIWSVVGNELTLCCPGIL
ncbi:uncharacterized protein LOC141619625 [Silene latifolia]|uniref:uncharacterized protein LOC141619625 n=1 Tax=Silene latifolia TaxID=37657 RepID=UPI003D7730F5